MQKVFGCKTITHAHRINFKNLINRVRIGFLDHIGAGRRYLIEWILQMNGMQHIDRYPLGIPKTLQTKIPFFMMSKLLFSGKFFNIFSPSLNWSNLCICETILCRQMDCTILCKQFSVNTITPIWNWTLYFPIRDILPFILLKDTFPEEGEDKDICT